MRKKPKLSNKKALQKAGSNAALFPNLDDVTSILEFLENFRLLTDPRAQLPSKLISMKVPEPLLSAFRFKCDQRGIRYQTMIKRLMEEWLKKV